MRRDQDYCERCGNPIEVDMIGKVNICGNCADELRAEEGAFIAQAQAESEAEERARYEAEEIERVEEEHRRAN